MKLFNLLAGAGVALMIGATAPIAWGQANEPGMPNGTTAIAPAATSPTVPGEKAAPGAPGSGVSASGSTAPGSDANGSAASNPGAPDIAMINSGYVHKKIDEAQAEGKDVSAARMQAQMGDAAMKKGMNDEAAQHFETALRAIGVMPNTPGQAGSPNRAMPGAMD